MQLVISQRARVALKIKKRAVEAAAKKEHRDWHIAQAAAMRKHADGIQKAIDAGDIDIEQWEEAKDAILHLKTQALEHENGTCMEDH